VPCGLYGKLPAKRDFVAASVPRAFLAAFEPWLQGGLSASRASLGTAWQEAYLRAPIWRFWLGAELCGEPILGALMPSVDGIGRYFPLALIARPGDAEALPPPELDPFEGWFSAAEALLLGVLTREDGFDAVAAEVAALPDPLRSALPPSAAGAVRLRDGTLTTLVADDDPSAALARLRPLDHARLHAGMSYWWTAGGEDFSPRVAACRRFPDPYAFAGMLTGRFDALGG
jgi:type VI secretion system protein ImpM